MTLVVIKLNEHNCRAVIASNFTHSFCGSSLVKALGLAVRDLPNPPAAATSDGTPIEFLGEAMCTMELGPWYSDGQIPLLVAWDCPADVLIGQDLIKEISKKYPVKFEFYKNAVNIGGTRVSMLDPLAAEEKFISVVVMDPHTNKEVGMESWKKGNKEVCEPGGLVKRRVEVVKDGGEGSKKATWTGDEPEEEPLGVEEEQEVLQQPLAEVTEVLSWEAPVCVDEIIADASESEAKNERETEICTVAVSEQQQPEEVLLEKVGVEKEEVEKECEEEAVEECV